MRKHNSVAFLFFVMLFSLCPCHSDVAGHELHDDNCTVVFGYDASGNRISRGLHPSSTFQENRAKSKACNIACITQDEANPDIYLVSLDASAEPSACTLSVCDMSGRCFMSRQLSEHAAVLTMTGLPPGAYIVNVSTSEAVYSVKIIKSRLQ